MARDWTAGGAAQTGHLRAEVLRLLRGEGLASGAGVPPGGEVLVLGCGQARAGDTSETLPRHFRDIEAPVPGYGHSAAPETPPCVRGQARLAWTIASGLPGARVTGSEASEAQLRG